MQHNTTDLYSQEWFDNCFKRMNVPVDLRRAVERIISVYNIGGICDPGYIANVIAKETGMGDGQSHFYTSDQEQAGWYRIDFMVGKQRNTYYQNHPTHKALLVHFDKMAQQEWPDKRVRITDVQKLTAEEWAKIAG